MVHNRKSPYPSYQSSNPILADHDNDLDIFLGKPFWCGNNGSIISNCCFNHLVGLPIKNGIEHPVYDYELDVVKAIEVHRNVWIKKASGIGMTELVLRYLAWKIVSSNELEFKKIMIISGTMLKHSNNVKERLQGLFKNRFPGIQLQSKFTELWIKNCNIICMPSRNVKDIRGYTDVSYLFIDEADYFEDSVVPELLHAITRYEEKSHATTIMVSTPNKPDGLFQSIERDPKSKYHKIVLLYTAGLGKIYNVEEINKKKNEPEFLREYAGQYLGRIGNLFTQEQITDCILVGEQLKDIPISQYNLKLIGVDFGYSSSKTAITMVEFLKEEQKAIVRYSEEFDKADPNTMCDLLFDFHRKHWNLYYLVDGSNRGSVNLLKIKLGEPTTWDPKTAGPNSMKCIPVNFPTEHKNLLNHMHMLISQGYVGIPSEYSNLITGLRTCYAKELDLDKNVTSFDDSIDALRLSLKGIIIK